MNASEQIDELIAGLTDWRGKTLANLRRSSVKLIRRLSRNGNGGALQSFPTTASSVLPTLSKTRSS